MQQAGKIFVSKFKEIRPHWSQPGGPGTQMATNTLIGGPPPYLHWDRDRGIVCNSCAAGTFLLPRDCVQVLHRHPVDEVYVLVRGRVTYRSDEGPEVEAEPFDCMYAPSGVYHAARTIGTEDAWIIWFWVGLCRPEDFERYPDESK